MLDEEAPVPVGLQHQRFVTTPLTTAWAALDFASYSASPEVIRVHSDGRWPVTGFTMSDNLELVAKHESDHVHRRAFTFVLLSPSRAESFGCLYLNPLRDYLLRAGADRQLVDETPGAAAMVTFWLRQDQQDTGLAEVVVETVHEWLLDEWPLPTHAFRVLPGERSSRKALDRLDLRTFGRSLPHDGRPYIWYQR